MKRTLSLILTCLLFVSKGLAQTDAAVEKPAMADLLRSNGKIYVVVGVLLIILAGTIIYLISIESKVAKLEKQANGIAS